MTSGERTGPVIVKPMTPKERELLSALLAVSKILDQHHMALSRMSRDLPSKGEVYSHLQQARSQHQHLLHTFERIALLYTEKDDNAVD